MKVITRGMRDVPFFSAKQFKVGMTGLTHLKEYGYNNRHIVGSGYQSLPNGDIVKKPIIKKTHGIKKRQATSSRFADSDLCADPALHRDPDPDLYPTEQVEQEPKGYILRKSVIRNRILNYANALRKCPDSRKRVLFFWTVTFPGGTPDDTCYRLFNTWLTTLRQKKMLRSYLWIAERQPKKTNTIHFHLLIPHYMGVQRANNFMKQTICGLIRKGELTNWNLHAAKRYNGVDIAKDRTTKRVVNFLAPGKNRSLARYLTKYVTKNDTTMYRLPWHCSRDWSAMIVGVALTKEETSRFLTDRSVLDPKKIEGKYCDFYRWLKSPPGRLQEYLADLNYMMIFDFFGRPEAGIFSLN
jgi:hypothetical protein